MLDASRQARVGTLPHAAIVTQEELTSDFFGVRSPDGPRYVARGQLEFVPTKADTHDSVAALVSARGGEIRYTIEDEPIGPARISFRFSKDDDSYTNYVYTATATNVTPVEMTEVNGKSIAFTLAIALPIALLTACAVCFFVWRWTKR